MKISIITVCYNAEASLEQTILSVLNQSYCEREYIVIDGGSKDGTVDIIKKYAEHLSYWVSEPDKGIYDAMNKGVKHATGEWVCFMNAGDTFADDEVLDDVFGRKCLSAQLKVIGGNTNLIYPDRVELLKSAGADYTPYGMPYCHQSCFVRINDMENPWKFDLTYRLAADYKVIYDAYHKFGKDSFLTLDRIISNYKMEESTTFSNLRRAKREYLKIQSRHINAVWCKELAKYILRR